MNNNGNIECSEESIIIKDSKNAICIISESKADELIDGNLDD